ncbi:hypothetical protein FB45DRAFT_1061837 [Roridomyces roridus]|uniref:Uncharacterized protein n=1 Tax=Roridomyces roridus TaxID=1738132 RepID=A0AAD7BJ17_9AGAR|nr:hypothetical protein FB45DRAFT_1061837 [Roridomyces roridus]
MSQATFHPIRLSAQVHSVSDAVDALQRTLGAQRPTPPVVECFQKLRAELAALRAAVGLDIDNTFADAPPVVNHLSRTAVATLWDDVPLQMLADAHRRNAEALAKFGNSDDQVYIECQKYLLLHPTKNGDEFNRMSKRTVMLAHKLARG